MSLQIKTLSDLEGIQYASASWTATTASVALIAAPSTGKTIDLRWIYAYQSAVGSVTLAIGTTGGSTIWYWPGANGNPVAEEAAIRGGDGQAIVVNVTGASAAPGNGVMRCYYRIVPTSGGTSTTQGF